MARHLQKTLNLQRVLLNDDLNNDNKNNTTTTNNNNNNNFHSFLPPPPQSRTPPPSSPYGGDGESDDDDSNDDNDKRNLTLTQRLLLDQPQRTAVVVGTNNAAASIPLQEKVRFSENLSKVFPEANDIFESDHQPIILEKEEITVSNAQGTIKELNEGKLPDQSKFFSGEEKEENLLKTQARKNVGVLSKGNEELLEYLASKYGRGLLQKKKEKLKFIWKVVKYIRIILILVRTSIIS